MKIQIVIDGSSLRRVARALRSSKSLALLVAFVLLASAGVALAISEKPQYAFVPGTIISASQVNTNFAALFGALYDIEQDLKNGVFKGDKGDPGSQKGPIGPKGEQGDKGPDGVGQKGDTGQQGDPGQKGDPGTPAPMPLLVTEICAKGNNSCCGGLGGTTVKAGLDTSRDGVLDLGELDSIRLLCNGIPSTKGVKGFTGPNGFTTVSTDSCNSATAPNSDATPDEGTPCVKSGFDICVLQTMRMDHGAICSITRDANSGDWTLKAINIGRLTASRAACTMRCYKFN